MLQHLSQLDYQACSLISPAVEFCRFELPASKTKGKQLQIREFTSTSVRRIAPSSQSMVALRASESVGPCCAREILLEVTVFFLLKRIHALKLRPQVHGASICSAGRMCEGLYSFGQGLTMHTGPSSLSFQVPIRQDLKIIPDC